MNIEEKTKMAHEWFMGMVSAKAPATVETAWKYADKMEAEAEKRIKAEAKEKREAVRKLLNDDGTFLEKEGQHFEDLNMEDSSQLEWQPDWSVAPEWAVYWFMDETLASWWSKREPYFLAGGVSKIVINNVNSFAPSFNYCGGWKDSLRKRP